MTRTRIRRLATVGLAITLAVLAACNTQGSGDAASDDTVSGSVRVDGSSTVFPITEAIAEEFGLESPDVDVRVGQSGTGGGFEKFCAGETDVANASRQIEDDEQDACRAEGVEWVELKIALDGISVVVNKENDFADCLTTDELKTIWEPNSDVKTWRDVKAEWPDEEIKLYGPGSDSGTFDFFTDAINGEEGASRSDYTQSEDDNQLVRGIGGDANSLGYFGFAYLEANLDTLRAVEVDAGDGCLAPTEETIQDGTYTPLARPLFIYPSKQALEEEEQVAAFTDFYLENVTAILEDVRYVALDAADLQESREALASALE